MALVLSGGGARAAYQAGALRGIIETWGGDALPFDVICGTSAGAINAVFLAAFADRPRAGIEALYRAWSAMDARRVYDPSWGAVLKSLWLLSTMPFRRGNRGRPESLLNNAPLRELLAGWLDFDAVRRNLGDGHLRNLCVTAMDYASGASVAFYEGGGTEPWDRLYRRGVPTRIGLDHVMASSAIPILFPAQRIGARYYGDGALRQLHPISPALKFGCTRLFIIGVAAAVADKPHMVERRRPTIGQMAGHLLNREFIDNLEADIELAERFNHIATVLPEAERQRLGMQHIESFVLTPSRHFSEIAVNYLEQQPKSLRLLFRLLGATPRGAGATFASYLMFDGGFCAELMELGYQDALRERERMRAFFGPGPAANGLSPA